MHKTARFGFVLSPDEMVALRWLADVNGGLSRAALVRRLIRQEARSRGLWPLVDNYDEQLTPQGRVMTKHAVKRVDHKEASITDE